MEEVANRAPCFCASVVNLKYAGQLFDPACLICGGTGERSMMVHFPAGPKAPTFHIATLDMLSGEFGAPDVHN